MANLTFVDIYLFLKQNGIIVNNYKHCKVQENKFNDRVNLALKTGNAHKGQTFNYNLYANLFKIVLKNNKNGDKKIFCFSDSVVGASWIDYLMQTNSDFAKQILEASQIKIREYNDKLLLIKCGIKSANFYSSEILETENNLNLYTQINKRAKDFLNNNQDTTTLSK